MIIKKRNFQIKAEKLLLRPFEKSDEDSVLEIFLNEEVKKTYMLPDFESRDEAVALFERLMKLSLSEERFVYGISLDCKIIGIINEVDKSDSFVELGYAINPAYKNQGYATMVLTACIKELKRMGYKTVRAGYFEENIASARVMEKCAMQMIDQTDEIEYQGKIHKCRYFEI